MCTYAVRAMFHGRSYILNYAVWGRLTPKCTNAVGARLTSECIYIVQSEQGWLKRASIYSLSVFTECSLSKRDLKMHKRSLSQADSKVHALVQFHCNLNNRMHLCMEMQVVQCRLQAALMQFEQSWSQSASMHFLELTTHAEWGGGGSIRLYQYL